MSAMQTQDNRLHSPVYIDAYSYARLQALVVCTGLFGAKFWWLLVIIMSISKMFVQYLDKWTCL